MVSKAQKQAETSQRLATVTSSWQLKNYGNTISEDDYVKCYGIDIDNVGSVAEIEGEAKIVNSMGNYNSVTFTSSVRVPFGWDYTNPESEENFKRFQHAALIRNKMLTFELEAVKMLALEEFEKVVK